MNELVPDGLDIAKAYQWDITLIVDPVDVALQGHSAAYKLKEVSDKKFQEGLPVRVHAFGAFVIEQWDEELEGYRTEQFDQIVASGESLGISFIQYSPNPDLNTLFLGLKNASLLEVERQEDEPIFSSFNSPKLVIPILDIDSIEIAA